MSRPSPKPVRPCEHTRFHYEPPLGSLVFDFGPMQQPKFRVRSGMVVADKNGRSFRVRGIFESRNGERMLRLAGGKILPETQIADHPNAWKVVRP